MSEPKKRRYRPALNLNDYQRKYDRWIGKRIRRKDWPGSPYAALAADLAESALTTTSRICHSTGANNAINRRTGKPPLLCRGARNVQLQAMHGMGMIVAPTDEAWDAKCKEMGL